MEIFSAKDLCSKSCTQIRMFALHPELRQKTPTQIEHANAGEQFQRRIARSAKTLVGEEFSGYYQQGDIRIFFSNDIVCTESIVEVKYVDPSRVLEDWYFNQSILQAAFYYSLLLETDNKVLKTAKFRVNAGYPEQIYKFTNSVKYFLCFGDHIYQITKVESSRIVDFYMSKAIAVQSWNTAKEFDANFKFKEFNILKKYFEYKKIK